MELLQLIYFCDAAHTENFSKTAEKYHVPPSNISQSIKRLERELTAPLFDRQGNRVTLNDRGRAFRDKAQQALSLLDEARSAVRMPEEEGRLRLAIHVNRRIVMRAIERFRSRYPAVDIVTTHDMTIEQPVDLVITDRPPEQPGFVGEKLFRGEIALAARKGLLPPGQLSAALLADKPFITMGPGNSLFSITGSICAQLGFRPRIALQSEDPFYIRKCVELGLGIAFVPTYSWRGQFTDQVELRPAGYARDVFLFRRSGGSPCAEAFCQVLREEIRLEQE